VIAEAARQLITLARAVMRAQTDHFPLVVYFLIFWVTLLDGMDMLFPRPFLNKAMSSAPEFFRRIAPVFLALSLFAAYLVSMAPGFTWAHDGADGGDLITAAATGGVPHPSGYPTFLLLARLFQSLPVGSIAFRTNLMSGVFTALTALLIYDVVVASPGSPAKGRPLAGLIAGYAYGFSALAWSQATITEVYALHVFFVALLIWLLVGRFAFSQNRPLLDAALGLAMGLALGNHLTALFLLPAVFVTGLVTTLSKKKETQWSIDWASLGRRLAWMSAGLLVYLSILLRAASRAPVNWGEAIDLQNLGWLVSGAFYQHYAFSVPVDSVLLRLISVAQLLMAQFGFLGLVVGLYHLIRNPSLSRRSLVCGWVAIASIVFSIGYNTTDSYIYLLPFFLVFAIWIGFGVGDIGGLLAQRGPWLSPALNAILLIFLFAMAAVTYPQIDLSADHRADHFEKAAFAVLPPQSIVVAKGDQALFSLWYYQFVLKDRPDLVILGDGLLSSPWYIDVLHDTYPTLKLSLQDVLSRSIAEANPARPTCTVMILDEQMSIDCYQPFSQGAGDSPYISINQAVAK